MIYLDHAATSLMKPPGVMEAVIRGMQQLGNAGRGAYESALDASRLFYDTRLRLAELFAADGPEQVAFTANATAALNIAIQGILSPGDHVITTQMEHNSVLRPLYFMESKGVRLTILPAGADGRISYDEMEAAIASDTRAIVCTHASNVTGEMNDLKRIGAVCAQHGLLLIADVAQTAGTFPISMKEMNLDVICFSGHKSLLGPQGTGGICVRKGLPVRPLLMGGSGVDSFAGKHPSRMPEALEAGTQNGPGIAGLRATLDYIKETGMQSLREQELAYMWRFHDAVIKLPGIRIYGDFSDRAAMRAPIVSWNLKEHDAGRIADELYQRYGLAVRAGVHCAPLMHRALKTAGQGAVRMSFSAMNTEAEIDLAIRAVLKLAEEG